MYIEFKNKIISYLQQALTFFYLLIYKYLILLKINPFQKLLQDLESKNSSKKILKQLCFHIIKIKKQTQTKQCQNSFNQQEYNLIQFRTLFIFVDQVALTQIADRYQQGLQDIFFLEKHQYYMEKHCSENIQSNKLYFQPCFKIFELMTTEYTQ
ncbi:unnamed protein product [Paramecium sonneborni]|uniref:Transmembrane protein n=1 Tax=Paramecium sonneborni TaxID=65129 RepID=A0A8S1M6J5_9CILI|nr:unnamed protein product [Paramecium sonneborni]